MPDTEPPMLQDHSTVRYCMYVISTSAKFRKYSPSRRQISLSNIPKQSTDVLPKHDKCRLLPSIMQAGRKHLAPRYCLQGKFCSVAQWKKYLRQAPADIVDSYSQVFRKIFKLPKKPTTALHGELGNVSYIACTEKEKSEAGICYPVP